LSKGNHGRGEMREKPLIKITDVKMKCPSCGWEGTVADCEPDVDGDGSLGCPDCFCIVIAR